MLLKDKIRLELEKVYGKYNEGLESEYSNKIVYEIMKNDYDGMVEWATYNQVIIELKQNLELRIKLKELLYRITDEENPTEACISVLENINDKTPELKRLYKKVKSFKKYSKK